MDLLPKTYTVHHETKTGPWYRPWSKRLMGTVLAASARDAAVLADVLWPSVPWRVVNGRRERGTVVHVQEQPLHAPMLPVTW